MSVLAGVAYAAVDFVTTNGGWTPGVQLTGVLLRASIGQNLVQVRTGRSAAMLEATQNTALTVSIYMQDQETGVGLAGLASTIVSQIQKPGAAFATISPTITDRSGGRYDVALTTAHLDTLLINNFRFTAPGAFVNDDLQIDVIAVNKHVATNMGITALPAVAVGASEGLALYKQVENIAVTGAALNQTAASRTITTGTGTGGVGNTTGADLVYDNVADVAGSLDFYYQFSVASVTSGTGVGVQWVGYLVGVVNTLNVFAYNWGGASWDQVGTVAGIVGTVNGDQEWELTNAHTGTGGNLGLVRIRFQNTGLTTATLKTDRILLGYTVIPATATDVSTAQTNINAHTDTATAGVTTDVNAHTDIAVSGIVTSDIINAIAGAVWDVNRTAHMNGQSFGQIVSINAGMAQYNFFLDTVVYDPSGNGQATARMRLFPQDNSINNATDGGSGEGEFATLNVETTYTGPNKIQTYKVSDAASIG